MTVRHRRCASKKRWTPFRRDSVKLPFIAKSQPAQQAQDSKQEEEPYREINVVETRGMIERDELTLIDVREPHEYVGGHLPGARLVPLRDLLGNPREYLKTDNIVFVCASGERSSVACEMAASLGFKHVYNVGGGTYAWIARGFPIEK
jgi:rhodanese-related sulfurtransferase